MHTSNSITSKGMNMEMKPCFWICDSVCCKLLRKMQCSYPCYVHAMIYILDYINPQRAGGRSYWLCSCSCPQVWNYIWRSTPLDLWIFEGRLFELWSIVTGDYGNETNEIVSFLPSDFWWMKLIFVFLTQSLECFLQLWL